MARRNHAPLVTIAVLAAATTAHAQNLTPTGSTRAARTSNGAQYDTLLLAPTTANRPTSRTGSRYDFLRESLPPTSPASPRPARGLKVRQASFQQQVDRLPAIERSDTSDRIYRGQEPADSRPRLNGAPGEIVREEIVPADTRPRLNSPPDVFRGRTLPPSPACQSPPVSTSRIPPTSYYFGTKSSGLGRPTNTTFYSTPTNPGFKESRYQVGRGIIGQPTLYVQKQPIRNFIRWLTF